MITPEQEKWLSHLSSTNQIKILPYNPESERLFLLVKEKVQEILGKEFEVFHRGASSMGISGQGELDIYIPVMPLEFDKTIDRLVIEFGEPGSLYPLKRARFNSKIEGTKVELFVINQNDQGWISSCKFEEHLKTHPACLLEYEKLKEAADGVSTQEYYRRKTEFINKILSGHK